MQHLNKNARVSTYAYTLHTHFQLRFTCTRLFQSMDECRARFCPAHRIRLPDGSCELVTEEFGVEAVEVCLKLIPSLQTDTVTMHASLQRALRNLHSPVTESPWNSKWLVNFFTFDEHMDGPRTLVRTIYLSLIWRTRSLVDLETLLSEIESSMDKSWRIQLRPTVLEFNSTISSICSVVDEEFHPYDFIRVNTTLYFVDWAGVPTVARAISKLFFCEQIELLSSEVELLGNDSSESIGLYYPSAERYFSRNEYIKVTDGEADRYRVCLQDVQYYKETAVKTATGSANLLEMPSNFQILFLIVFMFHFKLN